MSSLVDITQLVPDTPDSIDTQSVLSKSWRIKNQHESSYRGGKIQLIDNEHYVCHSEDSVHFVSITRGQTVHSFECGEDDPISSFAISPNNRVIYTAHIRSFQIKAWSVTDGSMIRTWKGHNNTISHMCLDPSGRYLATSCVDNSVRVWDAAGGFCTHNFAKHAALPTYLTFQPLSNTLLLAVGQQNGHIKIYDLIASTNFECNNHMSAITCVNFSYCNQYMISVGRDSVWCKWDLSTKTCLTTYPCYEAIEASYILPPQTTFTTTKGTVVTTSGKIVNGVLQEKPTDLYMVTVGNQGLLRIWNTVTKRCIYTLDAEYEYKSLHDKSLSNIEEAAVSTTTTTTQSITESTKPLHIAYSHIIVYHPSLFTNSIHEPLQYTKKDDDSSNNNKDQDTTQVSKVDDEETSLSKYFPLSKPFFITISQEQNLSFYEISTMRKHKTLIGFNDDIFDTKLIPNTRLVLVATNSPQLRIFNIDTFSAMLVTGHKESVTAIAVSPCGKYIMSASRDAEIRVWMVVPDTSGANNDDIGVHVICIATGTGHAEAIASLAFSNILPKYEAIDNYNSKLKTKVYNYNHNNFFAISGARDRTVKLWNLSPLLAFTDELHKEQILECIYSTPADTKQTKNKKQDNDVLYIRNINSDLDILPVLTGKSGLITIPCVTTVLAHDKDVNTLAISPNDKMLATSSQDRTVKIWNISPTNITPLTTLRGHRRGVWWVAFAPVDKVLISTSSDKTCKIWSLQDFSCIRTYQGHQAPVLRSEWLRGGLQFVSSDSDGILKLFNVSDGECVTTIDEPHTERVWGISVYKQDRYIVTAGADSRICVWEDVTAYELAIEDAENQAKKIQEQILVNAMRRKDWEQAFDLSLALAHPRRVYTVLSDLLDAETRYKRWKHLRAKRARDREARRQARVLAGGEDEDSDQEEEFLMMEAKENLELKVAKPNITLKKLIKLRSMEDLEKLTAYILEWNTNAKHVPVAQNLLYTMISNLSPEVFSRIPKIKDALHALSLYSQRHYNRINTLLQSSYLIDYIFSNMNMIMPVSKTMLDTDRNTDDNNVNALFDVLNLNIEESDLEDEAITDDDDVTDDDMLQQGEFMGDEGDEDDEDDFDDDDDSRHYLITEEDENMMVYNSSDDDDDEDGMEEDADDEDEDDEQEESESESEEEVVAPPPPSKKASKKKQAETPVVSVPTTTTTTTTAKDAKSKTKTSAATTAATTTATTTSKPSKKVDVPAKDTKPSKKRKNTDDDDMSDDEFEQAMAKLDRELPTDGGKMLGNYELQVGKDEEYDMGEEDMSFWATAGDWNDTTSKEDTEVKTTKKQSKKETSKTTKPVNEKTKDTTGNKKRKTK